MDVKLLRPVFPGPLCLMDNDLFHHFMEDQRRKLLAGQQPKRSAADDYDEIFGELLGGSTT